MLTLVLGGLKSGKSAYAVTLAKASGREVVVVATADALDDEMAERIERHRSARPPAWRVIENLAEAGGCGGPGRLVLIDSVDTILFSLLEAKGGADHRFSRDEVDEAAAACASAVRDASSGGDCIAVSNEVGCSLVPSTAYGRAFADALGIANQDLAKTASRCVFMVAGLALPLAVPTTEGSA